MTNDKSIPALTRLVVREPMGEAETAALRDGFQVPTRLLRCEWPPNDGVKPGDPRFDAVLTSIREEGIREPLLITLGWRVLDGNHRLAAARLLGIKTVPVVVWTETEFVG